MIARHVDIRIPFAKTSLAAYLPDSLVGLFVTGGAYGVRVFFVISGFLITSTSLQRWHALDKIKPGKFYRFRFARIFPCFMALLLVMTALHARLRASPR